MNISFTLTSEELDQIAEAVTKRLVAAGIVPGANKESLQVVEKQSKKQVQAKEVVCAHCGDKFETYRKDARYCRKHDCRKAYAREYAMRHYKEKAPRNCAMCSNRVSGNKRLCSDACAQAEVLAKRPDKTCINCGVLFKPTGHASQQKCDNCRTVVVRPRVPHAERHFPERRCAKCGTSFAPNSGRQKFCTVHSSVFKKAEPKARTCSRDGCTRTFMPTTPLQKKCDVHNGLKAAPDIRLSPEELEHRRASRQRIAELSQRPDAPRIEPTDPSPQQSEAIRHTVPVMPELIRTLEPTT